MATRKPTAKKHSKPPLTIRTFTLTAKNEESLAKIAATASDTLGRPVSSSAIMRALLAFVEEQPLDWIAREILPRIEGEIELGRVWGTKR